MSLIAAVYNAVLGLRKRTWASGMTVKKNEIVKSPLDNEDYERITATGGGTTDPANDVVNYVARSYVRTAALATPRPSSTAYGVVTGLGLTTSTLTILALNTRTSFLSITGRGCIGTLAISRGNSAGGLRVEILVDGRAVFDQVLIYNSSNQIYIYLGHPGPISASSYPDTISASAKGIEFVRSFQVFLTPTNAGSGGNAGGGVGVGYALEGSTA